MSLWDDKFTQDKNRRKRFRMVLEILTLVFVIFLLINAFMTLRTYRPFDPATTDMAADGGQDTGFIALSYFGVDRIGNTATLIGREQLHDQLKVLKDQGYVTVTQKDIEAYYEEGKPLPKRALFLMFEDGRRDTAIFVQNTLEELNYKASMMTYPEKFEKQDPTFLLPKNLKELTDSSYWEMGTNGYRLEFINVFDRYNNFIGEIDPLRYAMMQSALGRRYNHYLMDFIRDKYGVPAESTRHMESRISYDYERLRDIYTDQMGYVPGLYVLMHSNTGRFGNNNKVSALNDRWIRELFRMNFNREGYSFNQRNSSIYDLTRMQPQPYWSKNHLLMRIKYDINQPITFVEGDHARQQKWELLSGASEIKEEQYILTSMPMGRGLARLRDSGSYQDLRVRVRLEGNLFGGQAIYLRADDKLNRYIVVRLLNGELVVAEKAGGSEKELYRDKLVLIEGGTIPSVEEDKRDAEVKELETFARYAESREQAREYLARAEKRRNEPAQSVADGGKPYLGTTSFHARADRDLVISLRGDKISVSVNGHPAADAVTVSDLERGSFYLGAGWSQDAWSQRNLADDVYDGVFEKLIVTTDTGLKPENERVLYSGELTGWERFKFRTNQIWEMILGWFLHYL